MKKPTAASDELLTTHQLAQRWEMETQTLINNRSKGKGPRFITIGRRGKGRRPPVRYRLSEILEFEKEHPTNG